MLQFANAQLASRLGQLTFQVRRTANVQDADSIHDLRVAIRRFSQSVVAFSSLLPKQETKKILKRLNRMMDAAGKVRDRDVALDFLDGAGVSGEDSLRARIINERAEAERDLVEKTRRWSRANLSGKWRSALRLHF